MYNIYLGLACTLITFGIGYAGFKFLKTTMQKWTLLGFLSGLLVYSGLGVGYPEVPPSYLVYYLASTASFTFSFVFFCRLFSRTGNNAKVNLAYGLMMEEKKFLWKAILPIFFFLYLVIMIYPEFKLHRLVSPPAPDLLANFSARWEGSQGSRLYILVMRYSLILILPFFYAVLYKFRQRIVLLLLVVLGHLYIVYCHNAYLSRHELGIAILLVGFALWVNARTKRMRMMISLGLIGFVPLFLAFSYYYSILRLGGLGDGSTMFSAITSIIESETGFPARVGVPLIESGITADLSRYFTWVFTLPVPKFLLGDFSRFVLNYQISELILGRGAGDVGFFVILPGLVAEGIYIYGKYFFWIHTVSLGFLIAFFLRCFDGIPQLLFVLCYVILQITIVLNRGGVSSFLPMLINNFLLFYLYSIFLVTKYKARPAFAHAYRQWNK